MGIFTRIIGTLSSCRPEGSSIHMPKIKTADVSKNFTIFNGKAMN
jgi:hypothetical protein